MRFQDVFAVLNAAVSTLCCLATHVCMPLVFNYPMPSCLLSSVVEELLSKGTFTVNSMQYGVASFSLDCMWSSRMHAVPFVITNIRSAYQLTRLSSFCCLVVHVHTACASAHAACMCVQCSAL